MSMAIITLIKDLYINFSTSLKDKNYMKNFVNEFKAFAMRGNVVDLAVAVVIGAAFGKIVSSLVENIVTPLIGILVGGIDLRGLSTEVGEATIKYGVFLQSIFDFIVIALAIFLVIKVLAKLHKKEEAKPKEPAPIPEDIILLREIRDSLKK
jgi:large conductance mechanosensitive channel